MVSLAPTAQGPLGCGTYSCKLVNNGVTILEAKRTTSVLWGRRLDEASTATITLPVRGTDLRACCDGANRIDPLLTEVILSRNGIDVWQGWLMRDVTFTRDVIVINAHDILAWTDRRTLKQDHVDVGVDLTTIAVGYINDINAAGDLPFVIQALLTGITADRTVLASEDRYAGAALKELYETGLDATVVAGILLLGATTETCGGLQLRDTDIEGDPEVKLDGIQRATRVVVRGANGIRSVFPPVPPDVCFLPADFVSEDQQILDQSSADARAEDLFRRLSSNYPYYVQIPQGSSLSPDAPVHINALVPGNVFNYRSDTLCIPIGMAMRLVAVDVECAANNEDVRVTFEPLGDSEGDPV